MKIFSRLLLICAIVLAVLPASAQDDEVVVYDTGDFILGASWSPDGSQFATAGAMGIVTVFDAATGEAVLSLDMAGGREASTAAWSPDGSLIATGDLAGGVMVWDAATGELLQDLQRLEEASIGTVFWSPDGSVLAASYSTRGLAQDVHQVVLWNTETWENPFNLGGFVNGVAGAAFAPDGRGVAGADFASNVFLWDAEFALKEPIFIQPLIESIAGLASLTWAPDSTQVAVTDFDDRMTIIDFDSASIVDTFQTTSTFASSLSWGEGGIAMTSGSPIDPESVNAVLIYDPATGEELRSIVLESSPRSVAWSPDGATLLVAMDNGQVRLYR